MPSPYKWRKGHEQCSRDGAAKVNRDGHFSDLAHISTSSGRFASLALSAAACKAQDRVSRSADSTGNATPTPARLPRLRRKPSLAAPSCLLSHIVRFGNSARAFDQHPRRRAPRRLPRGRDASGIRAVVSGGADRSARDFRRGRSPPRFSPVERCGEGGKNADGARKPNASAAGNRLSCRAESAALILSAPPRRGLPRERRRVAQHHQSSSLSSFSHSTRPRERPGVRGAK